MKKGILIILSIVLFSVSCSNNKAQEIEDVRYKKQEIERKADKVFQELDNEIKKIEKEKGE